MLALGAARKFLPSDALSLYNDSLEMHEDDKVEEEDNNAWKD